MATGRSRSILEPVARHWNSVPGSKREARKRMLQDLNPVQALAIARVCVIQILRVLLLAPCVRSSHRSGRCRRLFD